VGDECVLHRMQLLAAGSRGRRGQGHAGVDASPVQQDGAGAALAVVAAFLGLVIRSRAQRVSSVVRVSTTSRCWVLSIRNATSTSTTHPLPKLRTEHWLEAGGLLVVVLRGGCRLLLDRSGDMHPWSPPSTLMGCGPDPD
jgi:hypothetical protein